MRTVGKLMLLPLLVLLAGGCSKAPVVEENAATQAMTTAEQSEASKYAPSEWQMAKDTLEAAKAEKLNQDGKFALFRSYGKSKGMFERAASLASQAESVAKVEMERVRKETEAILLQVQTELDSLAAMLVTLPAGKDTKAELELMKQDVAAFQQQLQGAQADFARRDYQTAKSKAMAVADKVSAMRTSLDAVMAKTGKRRS